MLKWEIKLVNYFLFINLYIRLYSLSKSDTCDVWMKKAFNILYSFVLKKSSRAFSFILIERSIDIKSSARRNIASPFLSLHISSLFCWESHSLSSLWNDRIDGNYIEITMCVLVKFFSTMFFFTFHDVPNWDSQAIESFEAQSKLHRVVKINEDQRQHS